MRIECFFIPETRLVELKSHCPNMGKNSDIGNLAVYIVKEYFLSLDRNATFVTGKNRIDLVVTYLGITEEFEIKGTADNTIAWSKLKVSSHNCHNKLSQGMKLIRVTNVGETNVTLYFMEYGIDFTLEPEPRWSVKRVAGPVVQQNN